MTAADLAAHTGGWDPPLRAPYRDAEVAELGPPTQGAAVLEILRILDGFDLHAMDPDERAHLTVEAVKIGLRDRDDHITDPAAMRVAASDLYADDWVAHRRDSIDPARPGCPRPGTLNAGARPTCVRRTTRCP